MTYSSAQYALHIVADVNKVRDHVNFTNLIEFCNIVKVLHYTVRTNFMRENIFETTKNRTQQIYICYLLSE